MVVCVWGLCLCLCVFVMLGVCGWLCVSGVCVFGMFASKLKIRQSLEKTTRSRNVFKVIYKEIKTSLIFFAKTIKLKLLLLKIVHDDFKIA